MLRQSFIFYDLQEFETTKYKKYLEKIAKKII